MTWYVYMIRLDKGRLYTGITTDVDRRFKEHVQGGAKAARTTRGSRDLVMVYQCRVGSKGEALAIEYRLKRSPKALKEVIVRRQCRLAELTGLLAMASALGKNSRRPSKGRLSCRT